MITITQPSAGARIRGVVTIELKFGRPHVDRMVKRFELFLDGQLYDSVQVGEYTGAYISSWDTGGVVDGPHILQGYAYTRTTGGVGEPSNQVNLVADNTAPEIDNLTPAPDSFAISYRPAITAIASDATSGISPGSIAMKLDGSGVEFSYSPETGQVSCQPADRLTETLHTVEITVEDVAGNQATASWAFTVDVTPPAITITEPSDGDLTNQNSITVIGSVDDVNAVVEVNEVEVVLESGNFSRLINLVEGNNVIRVTAVDEAGNHRSKVIQVTRDTIAPEIAIFSPQTGDSFKNSPIAVSGNVNDILATVTVNGILSEVNQTSGDFTVPEVALSDGLNEITATAVDPAGNSAADSVTVILDSISPVVAITSPEDGIVTDQTAVEVSGTIDDITAAVTVNGTEAAVDTGAGTFVAAGIALQEGSNLLQARAVDRAGNLGISEITITRDTTPPVLAITAPEDGFITNQAEINVTGTVDDNDAALTINGAGVTVTAGSFSHGITLNEGENTIFAAATDITGNGSSVTVTGTLDTQEPAAPVLDALPDLTDNTRLTITGTAETDAVITVTGGVAPASGPAASGNFSLIVFLNPNAENTLQAIATDAAGNVSPPAEDSITHDGIDPELLVTSPDQGANFPVLSNNPPAMIPVPVSGTVSDLHEPITVTVDGNQVTVIEGGFGTTVDLDVPSELGTASYIIEVEATDQAGNETTVIRLVTVELLEADTEPPVVTITAPQEGTFFNQTEISLAGNIADAAGLAAVRYEVNSSSFSLATDKSFNTTALIDNEGSNSITVYAEDEWGYEGSRTVTVALDTIPPDPPEVHTVNPASPTNSGQVSVMGTYEPFFSVRVPGGSSTVEALVTEAGNYSVSVPLDINTENTLQVFGIDRAGNISLTSTDLLVVQDAVAPTVSMVDPSAGATEIPLDQAVTVTFSEEMKAETFSPENVWLEASGGRIAAALTAAPSGDGVELTPLENFDDSLEVTVRVSTQVTDRAGNGPASSFSSAFTTVDLTAPGAIVLSPAPPQRTNLGSLEISGYDEAGATVSVKRDTVEIGSDQVAPEGQFNISVALLQNQANALEIAATDEAGNEGPAVTVSIIHDNIAPQVETVNPADGATDVALDQTVTITFNEALNSATVPAANSSGGTITITDEGGIVEGALTLNSAKTLVNFIPASGLADSSQVTVTVTTGVKDLAGNALAAPVVSGFFADDNTPPDPPVVSEISPPSPTNATQVTLSGTAEPESEVRVNGGVSQVTTAADPATGAFSIDVTLNPDEINPLLVTAVDASGNESAATEVQVTQDSTPPSVLDIVPADGAQDVSPGAPVVATFSETIDPDTIEGALTLQPEGGEAVEGEVVISGGNSVLTFTPASDLIEGTLYNVEIDAQVKDMAGNALESQFWSVFTTAGEPPVLTPDKPVVDAVFSPTTEAAITVSGSAWPSTTIEVSGGASAVSAPVDGAGDFSLTVTLKENELNTLQVTASNEYGASTPEIVEVLHDTLGPVITITSPEGGTVFPVSPIPVSGTAVDAGGIKDGRVTVNGEAVDLSGGSFFINAFELSAGENFIAVEAEDNLGNQSQKSVQVTYNEESEDTTPPIVTITSPVDGEEVTGNCRVAGTVVDAGFIEELWMNDIQVGLEGENTFDSFISLTEGENTILVRAIDAVGLEGADSVEVLVDVTPPLLTVDEPVSPLTTASSPIMVAGATEQGCRVEVDNGWETFSTTASPDGSFSLAVNLMENTFHILKVNSFNTAGARSETVVLEITHDSMPFVIQEIIPEAGALDVDLAADIQFTFSRPVDVDSLKTSGNLKILAGTEEIPGNITVVPSGEVATFAPYQIFPGSTEISIIISDQVTSINGMKLIAEIVSSFITEQAPTTLSGVVLTPELVPLAGAVVRIEGTGLEAVVNSLGGFIIEEVPAGIMELVVDGSVATVEGGFPDLVVRVSVVEGRDNRIKNPIFITPINTICGETVGPGETEIDFNDCIPGLKLTVEPGSVIFPDGRVNGEITVTLVDPNNLPGRLPNNIIPPFLVRLDPGETEIMSPATISFPNLSGLAAGEEAEIFAFGGGIHNYGVIGTGVVSEDELTIVSETPCLAGLGYVGYIPPDLLVGAPRYLRGRVVDSGGSGISGVAVSALSGDLDIETDSSGYYEIPLPAGELTGVKVYATVSASLSESGRGNAVLVFESEPVEPEASGMTEVLDIVVDSFEIVGDLRLVNNDGQVIPNQAEDSFDENGRLAGISQATLPGIEIMVFRAESNGAFPVDPIITIHPGHSPSGSGDNIRFEERIFNGPEGITSPGQRSPVRIEPGELLRVIAYSPSIGYLGLNEVRVPDFSGGVAQAVSDIVMEPPEVIIKAERIYYANDQRQRRIIPPGGAALLTDQLMLIHITWQVPEVPGAKLYGRLITGAVWGKEKSFRFTVPPGESLRVLEIRGSFPDSQAVIETISEAGNESVEIAPERSFKEERILPLTAVGPGGYIIEAGRKFEFRVSSDTEVEPINISGITVSPPDDGGNCEVVGEAGAVEGGSAVTITNIATEESVTVAAEADGTFSALIPASVGDLLEIISEDETGNVSDPIYIEVVAVPSITDIVPDHANRGEEVVIRGNYFSLQPGENEVSFKTPTLSPVVGPVTFATQTMLTVVVPEEAITGLVRVTVGGERSNGFLFTITRPVIVSVEPSTGVPGESLTVVIEGENTRFSEGGATVDFGYFISVDSLQVESQTRITAGISISDLISLGKQKVTVTTDAIALTYSPGFIIAPAESPRIDWIKNVRSGVVEIHGSNFRPNLIDNRVYFNQSEAVVPDAAVTVIEAVIPPVFVAGEVAVKVGDLWSNRVAYALPTPTPSPTPEGYYTPSPTTRPTATPEGYTTPPPTPTPEGYRTPPPTATPISTPTATPTPAGYQTPAPTSTATPISTPTATPTPAGYQTPAPTSTATPAGYKTPPPTPTPEGYHTPAPTVAPTFTPAATLTPAGYQTPTPTPRSTATPVGYKTPAPTPTPEGYETPSPPPTPAPTPIPAPTAWWWTWTTPPPTPIPTPSASSSPTTTPTATPTPTPFGLVTFRDTAEAQIRIYGALKALDEINKRTGGDNDLQVLQDFFSGGDNIIEALANGAAAPEVLEQAGTFEGKYSHYAHTGLLYTGLLAFSGIKPVSDEDIAFGYGCLAHYVVDKHVNPVIKDFAGWVDEMGGAGKTVSVFNYFDGRCQTGQTEDAGGQVNVTRHKWLKNWFVKGLFMEIGAWTNNTTAALVDDLGYYSTDPFSSSQQQIIENSYNYLWEIEYLFGLDSGSQTMSDYTSAMAAAHEEDYSLRASDISDFTVFPNSHEFYTLFFALGEVGDEYSGLYSRFRQALDAAAAEIVELFLKTAPYLEDELLSKITIRDTRLENIDLYTGELSERDMPDLTGDINPDELYALVANSGSNSVLPVRIDGGYLDTQSTIGLSGAPERVTFGPTGRFAYVSLAGGGVEWIDMTPNDDLKWWSEHGELEGSGMGSGSGPLEVSLDSSRLYVGRENGYVDEYDLSRRELISSIAVGATCRDMDITVAGKDLMVTTHNEGAGSGTLEKLEIDFDQPLSSGGSTTLAGRIRGVATETYGDTTYVATKGSGSSGLLSPYFDPLYVVRGSGVDKVNTRVDGSNYTFIVDSQVYYVPMLVWPAVVSTLCSINTPPYVLMQIITHNPTGLLGLLPLGGGLLAPIIFSTPVPIIVFYKMNPVGLYQGVDIAVVPASKYGISPAYGAFGFSGNIGVLDRDSRKFYAGTTNELVSLYMSGGPYYPLKRIGVSQVGDIIGLHPGKDNIGFGEGEKIFQALHQGDAETFTTFPGLFPAFIPGIRLGGNLSRPSDAAFQPIVYRYNNLALDGEGEYMVFSRYTIGDIINGSSLLGVEFKEQQDRFWSLKAEGNPTLEVEFKDGDLPKVYLGESRCRPTPEPGPSIPPIEVPEIDNVEREYKCAFYVENFGAEEIVNEYKVHAPGADSVWFKLNGDGTKVAVENDWATHTYNMGEDLVPDLLDPERNEFWFQPEGGSVAGESYGPLYEWLIPCPKWLAYLIKTGWDWQNLGDKIKTSFEVAYPDPALEAHIERVQDWVPFIGGHPLGIRETQVGLAGELTCVGQGLISGFGKSGFDALGSEIGAELTAEGTIRVDTTKGIYFHKAKLQLDANGEISREFGIIDAIPYVNTLSFPGKGWINDHCKITPYFEAGISVPLSFKECDQPPLGLCFDNAEPAGTIGARVVGVINLEVLEAELGAGGEGTVTLQIPQNPGYLKEIVLKINTWLKATALNIWEVCDWSYDWEWKWEFGEQTGNPPGGTRTRTKSIGRLISRDYIKDPDYTRSIVRQRRGALDRFRGLPRGASTATLGLAQAVFPGGNPALAAQGDELLLLFVYDDPEKELQQALEIAYLSYDGTSWTTWTGKPPLLTDDTHADLNPRMVVDGSGNYLAVWERVRDPNLSEAGGVEAMAAQLEIAYSVYNGSSWSELSYLTDNDYLDSSPRLSVSSSGRVMLIWNSNAESGLFGDINHPSEIRSAIWDGAGWSDEMVAVSGLNGVYIPAVSYTAETEATLVFSKARDGDDPDLIPPSQDMSEIYYSHYDGSDWTAATTLTDDSLDDVSPRIIDVEGTRYLIWSRDGEMVMLNGLENWPPELIKEGGERSAPPDYKLVEDEDHNLVLVWAHASEEGTDIFYNVYDAAAGVWGEDQKLSGDDYLEKDFAPVFDQSGDLVMAYNRVEVEMEEINGYEVPRLGQTDLYVLRHSLGIDLGIDSEDISFALLNPPPGPSPTPYPAPGDEVEIKAEVKNRGDKVCNSVEVAFYNGDPDEGGAQISATQVIDTITPGGSREASVAWTIPADDIIYRIYVVVDPANAIDELNEDNNKAFSDALLLPDLCLKSLYYQPQGEGGIVVDALIANQGTVSAPSCTLELRKDSVEGELLKSEVVDPLTAGSEVTVSISVDTGGFSLQSEVVIYGIVDSGEEVLEIDETNNVNFNYIWIDFDHDGMVDAWERVHGLSPLLGDGGGVRDFVLAYVTAWGIPLHPGFNPADYPFEELDQETDRDGDGLTNLEEHLVDSDPLNSDTDEDGMPDGWECDYGLDLKIDDGALDPDEDGFTNLEEYTAGTDPQDGQSHP